jgi:hypothetical protein
MSTLQQTFHRQRADEPEGHACYSVRAQASTLLVELSSGERWVLPWMHFVFARHHDEGKDERLVLTFASHEVKVSGHNLVVLAETAAKAELESIRELPPKYRDRLADDPFVTKITVRDLGGPPSPVAREVQ